MNALIIVDLQNDFLENGALAVQDSSRIVLLINRMMRKFDLVVASRDCHPRNHCSLASNHPGKRPGDVIVINGCEQVLWPDHCLIDTPGADLTPLLNQALIRKQFVKGERIDCDCYSCFRDNDHRHATGMAAYLHEAGVTEVYLAGLALDYCVKSSALDAIAEGFATYVIIDACRGINMVRGDVERAITTMVTAGVAIITAEMVMAF